MPLPSLIALVGFKLYLGWSHAPYPSKPPVVWPLTRSPRAHTNHCRFLNEVCDVPPLCPCTAWPFFENAFHLVRLANPIHPIGFLSGKPSCSARHVGSLLRTNTVFTHLSVTGLFRLDCGLSYLSVSPTTWEVL